MLTQTTFRYNFLLSDWQKFKSLTTNTVDKAMGKSPHLNGWEYKLLQPIEIGITKGFGNNYENYKGTEHFD